VLQELLENWLKDWQARIRPPVCHPLHLAAQPRHPADFAAVALLYGRPEFIALLLLPGEREFVHRGT
jgi:hypothetical protein